jgi:hypothetical protein
MAAMRPPWTATSTLATGNNDFADAYDGNGELASATGTGSEAFADNGSLDTAFADGTGATAEADNGNLDSATIFNLTGNSGGSALRNTATATTPWFSATAKPRPVAPDLML